MVLVQSDFPDEWSKDCENKGVKVEVLVRDSEDDALSWIEIPTTNVEVYEEKDRTSDIYTLGKVEFPALWGTGENRSVTDLIQGFNEGDSISYVRISFWHNNSDSWIIKHFGFASGVGSSAPGVMKMWVYDFADFVKGIPAGFFFDNVFVDDVVNVVTKKINQETPGVAVGSKILFSYNPIYGLTEVGERLGVWKDGIHDAVADGLEAREVSSIFTADVFAESVDERGNATKTITIAKTFKENRHTIEDVLDWLTTRIGARWWFEPTENGVVLVIDKQKESRLFMQGSVWYDYTQNNIEAEIPAYYDRIKVISNTALYDINPINTVIIRGDLGNSLSENILEPAGGIGTVVPVAAYGLINDVFNPSRSFPYVKARADPLYQRALKATNNPTQAELNFAIIDTDDQTIEQAKASAVSELIEILSEQAEGFVLTYGNPKLTVFDSILVYPTCNTVVNRTQIPLRFEVEATRHKKQAGDIYKCEIYVSVFIEEEDIEFVEERMATANEQAVNR